MLYKQAIPMTTRGNTLKSSDQQSNPPWIHHRSLLGEIRKVRTPARIEERD